MSGVPKSETALKKVFVKTFGCQMNAYDSERIVEALEPAGYGRTEVADDADVIVLNTCHIREKAADKMYSDLGRVAKAASLRPFGASAPTVVVAGCVAQAEGAEIARRMPSVGVVVGPQSYHRLPDLLERKANTKKPIVSLDFPAMDKFQSLPERRMRSAPSAFLTVQEGCDKFCTFCVVPYTRGAEYSRPVAQILDEARGLADRGAKEITLLGQNVNAYRGIGKKGANSSLADLLGELSGVAGLERLRYTTSHPNDMSADLIDAHGALPKLMPYLHLPFQAGSDRILHAMNRNHTAAAYVEVIAALRKVRPDIALSTDIIVGFPGETDADFEETVNVVETVSFASSFSFKYSPRPGTPAADKPDQVPEEIKTARLTRLQAILREQQTRFNDLSVGATLPILWEAEGKRPGTIMGRSPFLQTVVAAGDKSVLGTIAPARIVSASPNTLQGVINSVAAHATVPTVDDVMSLGA